MENVKINDSYTTVTIYFYLPSFLPFFHVHCKDILHFYHMSGTGNGRAKNNSAAYAKRISKYVELRHMAVFLNINNPHQII